MTHHRFYGLIALFLGLSVMVSCASAPIGYSRFKGLGEDVKKAQALDPAAYPEADGVVVREYNETRISWLPGIGIETYIDYRAVARVFRSAENYLTVDLRAGRNDELADLAARVIHPDGTVVDLDEKDIYRRNASLASYGFDSAYESIRFNFPQLSDGDVVEYRFTRISRGIYLSDEWTLPHYEMPVLDSEYVIKLPRWLVDGESGWNFSYKTYNFDRMPEPEIETGATEYDHKTYRWRVTDIPKYKRERYVESEVRQLPQMKFILSSFSTPAGYAAFYYNKTLKEQMPLADAVKKKAVELTAASKNDIEKIEALRLFVQDLHYSAEHTDYGYGVKPNPPETVLKRGFGDCKDKAILLVVMLRAVGIEADPVLVLTRNAGLVDPDFHSNEFNHMIVRAVTSDKKAIWIDGTMKGNTLGWLPWALADTYGLLVTEKAATSKMLKLPSYSAADNGLHRSITVELRPDRSAHYTIKDVFLGEFAWTARRTIGEMRDDELVRFIRDTTGWSFFMIEPTGISRSSSKEVGNRFEFSVSFDVPQGADMQPDGRYAVSIWPLYTTSLAYDTFMLGEPERRQPFYLGAPRHVESTSEIMLPAGAVLVSKPGEYTRSTPDGEMSYHYTLAVGDGGKVRVTEAQRVEKPSVPAAALEDMRKFFSGFFRDDQLDRVLIEMPPLPAETAPAEN